MTQNNKKTGVCRNEWGATVREASVPESSRVGARSAGGGGENKDEWLTGRVARGQPF